MCELEKKGGNHEDNKVGVTGELDHHSVIGDDLNRTC